MNYAKCADFFLAGLTVAWPAMLWAGDLEAGVVLWILLLFALFCSGMMVDEEGGELR